MNERGAAASMVGMRMDASKKTFTTPIELEQLRIMKETMTYCVENFDFALQEASESKACEKAY